MTQKNQQLDRWGHSKAVRPSRPSSNSTLQYLSCIAEWVLGNKYYGRVLQLMLLRKKKIEIPVPMTDAQMARVPAA